MLNRREFIATSAAVAAVGALNAPVIATAAPRAPFLRPSMPGDDPVSSIVWHLWDHPMNPAPTGPLWVESVGEWDGIGYPVVLYGSSLPFTEKKRFFGFYDHEWAPLRAEAPDWYYGHNFYPAFPNIHSYIREKRFGESPIVMRNVMEINQKIGHSNPVLRKILVGEYLRLNGVEVPWLRT